MLVIASIDQDLQRVAEKLPTAPRLLVELGGLLGDPHVGIGEVVSLLRRDQPLVARLIRMANSAAYAPERPVGSLEDALALIGFAEVHRLVGVVAAAQLADLPVRLYPIDAARLRQNSLFTAVLMEELAGPAHESPRVCYTVGLLRTIGMLALESLTPLYADVPAFRVSGETALAEWERRQFGLTNVEVAEKVLTGWRLPHEVVAAIRHHYRPAGRHNPLIHLLTLAASAAADRDFGIPGEEGYLKLAPENFSKAGLDVPAYQFAAERAQRKYEQLKLTLG